MRRVLFVCHGNICRSPMAEYLMKDIVSRNNRKKDFEIASAATSYEAINCPIYRPVKTLLQMLGIDCDEKRARHMEAEDYQYYDEIYVMDFKNMKNIKKICDDPDHKIKLLRSVLYNEDDIEKLSQEDLEIEDPWYTGDFEKVYKIIKASCEKIFEKKT